MTRSIIDPDAFSIFAIREPGNSIVARLVSKLDVARTSRVYIIERISGRISMRLAGGPIAVNVEINIWRGRIDAHASGSTRTGRRSGH